LCKSIADNPVGELKAPVLKNARHEIFAQAVAQGKEIGEAYVKAGFKANTGNPSTLKNKKRSATMSRRIA
jgi:hypothetical protein